MLSGKTHIANPHANFHNAFAGSSHSSNDVSFFNRYLHVGWTSRVLPQYATATFKVLNAYAGWSNVNYVLNNVKNPVRTLKIAGPLGLGICAVLYLLANVAYFAYVIIRRVFHRVTSLLISFVGRRRRRRYWDPVSLLLRSSSRMYLVGRHSGLYLFLWL